ncbi:MAG TPA: TlpA disulfide reductase family protein [Myxococcota bacterium]|jgi:thiol-disulfide isomerase/thioredoxin
MAEADKPEQEEKLEGEDAKDLVGIMYSEKKWVVPMAAKAAFFWFALILIVPLAIYTGWKRVTFKKLLVDSVVEPEGMDNEPAPAVKLPQGDGGAVVDISQYKGQWVLLNFWATWCAPCRDEMPSLEMLNRRLSKDGKQLHIVAASVDDDWKEVNRFFGDTKPTFTVLWDKDKPVSFSYGTRKFPETYLIDPDGHVAAKFTGPRDWYNQGTVQYFTDVLGGKRKPVT